MVFSSLNFLFVFLPLAFALYFIAPRRFKNFILFVSSLIFYAWGEPVYVVLMLFSTAVDFVHGQLVEKHRGTAKAKAALISSIVINLALLCVFKYADFALGTINSVFGTDTPLPGLPLPIGISFYTFQTMSYTIDVYRGEAKAQKNVIDFGAYVALFPQLIAGPIVRYQTVADELTDRIHSSDEFAEGARRFTAGLAKKVLLANNIGAVWTLVSGYSGDEISVLAAWIGIAAYAFQIYFDFSGYSDMAIGLGRMMGFHFLENFNYPYISRSITEFWRRWHISLGTWFREYVYIPLGGNRCGAGRQIFNIAAVWFLTGLWHGASWNFAAWGVYYCILLVIEKLFLLKFLKKAPSFVGHIYTLFFVIIGWVLFAFDDISAGISFLGYMFGSGVPFVNTAALYLLKTNLPILIILCLGSTPLVHTLFIKMRERLSAGTASAVVCAAMAAGFLISMAYLVSGTYNPFLYFRF